MLVVDDDEELNTLLELRLEGHGYRPFTAVNAASALASIAAESFDAILLDMKLGAEDGLQLLSEIRKRVPNVPVVILTAHGSIDLAVEATQRGAFGFITKPFHDHELLQKVAHAVETTALRREVERLRRMADAARPDHLVGSSKAIKSVRDVIGRVAATDVTVLITGESGTGKELAARSLHQQSPRASRPFIAVNCAALPANLLESELFGHVRGAFTGALRDREGLFAAADGGTLFLDEIGDASPSVQAKLLRVLQERRFTRVGSTQEHEVDVRIVAATNRDLRADVSEARFREDLLFRIHVVPIQMPPLRSRLEDVPLLVDTLLQRVAGRHARPVPTVSSRALEALMNHRWPGNVRELANVIEAAMLFAEGDEIRAEHLATLLMPGSGNESRDIISDLTAKNIAPSALPTLREVRDSVESAYLREVLRRTSGNVAAAARLAGRNRSDFYEIMRKHGITKSNAR